LGETPLLLATQKNDKELISKLLKMNAHIPLAVHKNVEYNKVSILVNDSPLHTRHILQESASMIEDDEKKTPFTSTKFFRFKLKH
jgi:hypothetical protein